VKVLRDLYRVNVGKGRRKGEGLQDLIPPAQEAEHRYAESKIHLYKCGALFGDASEIIEYDAYKEWRKTAADHRTKSALFLLSG
jgi:hypothetical protein